MANSFNFLLTISLFLTALILSSSTVSASTDLNLNLNWALTKARCQGSIAECMGNDEEFSMDSEINRRILATTDYISYAALQRGSTPCSQRGASYYNCQAGAQANPYSRGCSAITQCRS